ncbi:alpha/beta hydrolase [Bacilli bacterium]|nr:alpha/beta hydrolase [Bacilli bacterium]GHU46022.1 alpha/beta hydrolase [Bacilli bacterium]
MTIFLRRLFSDSLLTILANLIVLSNLFDLPLLIHIVITLLLIFFFSYFNIRPQLKKGQQRRRLDILEGGYELILASSMCFVATLILNGVVSRLSSAELTALTYMLNGLLATICLGILLLNGLVRIFTTSTQTGITLRLLLILLWWVPLVNLFLLRKLCGIAAKEYAYETTKHQRNANRAAEKICQTQYPILLVHGIFFRDWKAFNYWGRIPKELIANGATIFYGKQQSTAAVPISAAEIRDSILQVIEETGAEKVNIIAHSKGGIDSRYAISKLGMANYVASLTTINTPHFGCNYARKLMAKLPDKAIQSVGGQYEKLFTKLGDTEPDFMSGLVDLTDHACAELNKIAPDVTGVLYQSVGSRMTSATSAAFPLNLGYLIIKPMEGENDGLVSTSAMVWGNYLGLLTSKGKQGISHGDMIDLTRKNIDGFDVCEFYVDLVAQLKNKGY